MTTKLYYLVAAGAIVDGPTVLRGGWKDTTNMECLADSELKVFGWLPEVEVKPELAAGEVLDTATLVIGESQVTKTWSKRAMNAAETAAANEVARQTAVDANIQQDATVASLKAMTNAEFDAWWAANVTNLAQAGNVLKRVTRLVLRRVA